MAVPFCLRQTWAFRNTLCILLIPLCLLPLPLALPGTVSRYCYFIFYSITVSGQQL